MSQIMFPNGPRSMPAAYTWLLRSLAGRLLMLALLFFLEKLFLDQFVDFDLADSAQGLGAILRAVQHVLFRFATVFGASLIAFAFARERQRPSDISSNPAPSARWILLHLVLLTILAALSHSIYRNNAGDVSIALLGGAGLIVGAFAAAAAFLAFSPIAAWLHDARLLGAAWGYAAIIAGIATGTIGWLQSLWRPASTLTFHIVAAVLEPIVPTLLADPQNLVLSTGRFAIQIADACSGLEGVGLILTFSIAWLVYFRREYRFPRSLWILPIGLVLMFGLNSIRIAALLLIGYAGYPDVALFGFHSQAGWMAFMLGACVVVLLSRRATFLRKTTTILVTPSGEKDDTNPTAAYLVPLLCVLAAGMLSRAMSGKSEVFFPLRLIPGLIALMGYRRTLRLGINWSFTWRGVLTGTGIGILTIVTAHLEAVVPQPLIPPAEWLRPAQLLWISASWATLIIVVPVAEELAYRGYLMRRLAQSKFESMPFTEVRWPAICFSAVASAATQGSLFVPGVIAGVAYGRLIGRRGRFGEAVVAHAICNALMIAASRLVN